MLTGWVGLHLFLLAVFKAGGTVQIWHGVVWVGATFLGAWMAVGGRASVVGTRWSVAGVLTGIGLAVPILVGWIMSHFTDMSWDGMTSRGITVLKVMEGRPLTVDDDWVFGHISGGWIAFILGSWQGGKAINGLMILINGMVAVALFKKLLGNSIWASVLGVLTALNPVSIYQLSSFQVDGITANLFCLLVLAGIWVLFVGDQRNQGLWLLGAAGLGLAASKRLLGLYYACSALLLFLVVYFRTRKKTLPRVSQLIAAVALLSLLFFASRQEKLNIRTEGYGVGGGASKVSAYVNLPRPGIFAASAFAMTEVMPEDIRLKPPFAMTRRELRVFEELTPDPRAGGFGPQFSGAMLLAGIGCSALMLFRQPVYLPALFMILAAIVSSYFSHLWWARWTPQNWLILIGMLMTLIHAGWNGEGVRREEGAPVSRSGRITKGTQLIAVLAVAATAFNVALVAVYYGVGMFRQENMLNRQIELAKNLGEPVPIFIPVIQGGHAEGKSFLATEYWFRDRNVAVTKLDSPPARPRMELNKTETLFPLPDDWRCYLRDPSDEAVFRKRGCVED